MVKQTITKMQTARANYTRRLLTLTNKVSDLNEMLLHEEDIKGELFNVQALKEKYLDEIRFIRLALANLDFNLEKK